MWIRVIYRWTDDQGHCMELDQSSTDNYGMGCRNELWLFSRVNHLNFFIHSSWIKRAAGQQLSCQLPMLPNLRWQWPVDKETLTMVNCG